MLRNKSKLAVFGLVLAIVIGLVLAIFLSQMGSSNTPTSQEQSTPTPTQLPTQTSTEEFSSYNGESEITQVLSYDDFQLLIPKLWIATNSTPPNPLPTFKQADGKTFGGITILRLDSELEIDPSAEEVTSFEIDRAKVFKGTQVVESVKERYVLIYVPEHNTGYFLYFSEVDVTEQLALAIAKTFALK